MSDRPNVIWIMADDMGYGDLSCYNRDSKIPTPNMDRLAAEGMRFTDAHSSSAVCTPSRYSVLTGRYCWRTWRKRTVHGGFSMPLIDPARTTAASLLHDHGYHTMAVGKWHVGLGWQPKDGHELEFEPENWADEGHVDYEKPIFGGPLAVGFDHFFGIAGSLDMPPYCFIRDDRSDGIPSVEKSPYNPQQKKGFMTPNWSDEEVDSAFIREAVDFIDQHAQDQPDEPFFLYLTPSAPHRPCMPPEYAKGKSQAGARGDMVWVVDWMVGQILDRLDEHGLSEDTLIIVTSDNGARPCDVDGLTYDHKSCGDLRGYKADIWDGGHRVPFIVRWPGVVRPGSTCDETICLGDFLATLADVLDAELPTNTAEDSFSFLPLLRGGEAGEPRPPVIHHSWSGMFAVRDGLWKCIFGLGSGGFSYPEHGYSTLPDAPAGQLYDMIDDWREQHNLWNEHPDVVDRLEDLLGEVKAQGRSIDLDS